MKQYALLLILMFLCLPLSSCKDELIRPDLPTIALDPELKAYMASYGAGSYWIYEDENTGELDTMTLIRNDRVTERKDGQYYAEYYLQYYECTSTPRF